MAEARGEGGLATGAIQAPKRIGVVGAGTMGAQIAYQAALHGCEVVLCGRDLGRVGDSAGKAAKVLQRRVEKGSLSEDDFKAITERVKLSCDHADLAECELVIESVAEDREIKRAVLAEIARNVSDTAIIGTNSSTLPSALFEEVVPNPERLLNIHFFNPALMMQLVEVVHGAHTSEETMERSMAFARAIGKQPVHVNKETYGFLANRMLFIAMREAFMLVENGYVSMEDCDAAIKAALGWPMGPFALGDLVGLDVTEAILREGAEQTGEDRWAPPQILTERVERGELGRKTGKGFYTA